MKIFLYVFLLLLPASLIYSQKVLHKDAYNINGGISFSIVDQDHPEFKSKTSSFIFNPSLTYHILDIFTLGGNITFVYSEEKIESESGTQNSVTRIFELGPKARYYLHAENLSPFLDLSINYSHILPSKTEGMSYSLGAGINYFFTKSIALEPTISYTASYYSNPDYDSKIFYVGVGLNYHITD